MTYGTVNVDSVVSSDGVTSGGLYGFKNRIINGAMVIDQRNNGAAISTDGGFPVDRFKAFRNGGTATFTAQRSSVAPSGFTNSLLYTIGTGAAPTSTSYSLIQQPIEGNNVADLGFGTASAQTVTLSFWVRSSVVGTYGFSFRNGSATRSYVGSYTVNDANTWEFKTATVVGDTSGTWFTDSTAGIILDFDLGVGSSTSTTAGSWQAGNYTGLTGGTKLAATSGATFYITGVQLEKGSTATSFDYRPYGTELALCSRYFQNQYVSLYKNSSGSTALISDKLHTVMRAAPTVVVVTRESTIGANWDTDRIGTIYVEWGNGVGGEQRQRITYTASAEL